MKKIYLCKLFAISVFIIFLIAVCSQPVRAQTRTPTSQTSTPASPWKTPVQLTQDVPQIDGLALAVDSQGRAHAVWSQGNDPSGPTTSLLCARSDEQDTTQPVRIVQAPAGEMARQPSLLVDGQDHLHLAYSGGPTGEIFYTRANADLAESASGWQSPKVVSYAEGAAWPQIGLAPDGQLYIVYVIPFNEKRGVYWLRSADGGETWTIPELVFDAGKAGWKSVGHAALAISPDGSLQIVFEQASLPGEWPVQGVFYTNSFVQAGTVSFSPPENVASASSHMPQLAIAGDQLHLVYFGGVGLETRRLDLLAQSNGWSAVEHLNGWQYMALGEPAFGLAADAQNSHLVSPLADGSGLRYSAWQSGVQTGWTNPPEKVIFTPAPLSSSLTVTATATQSIGGSPAATAAPLNSGSLASVATRLNGGWLAAAWVTQWETGMQVFLALRSIPETTVPATRAVIPTGTPLPTPSLTAAPPSATSTPILNIPGTGSSSPVNPIYLGGGLAALIVLLALGGYWLFIGRRR